MTRKELTADIKKRVAAGESKRAIFSRYSMTEWEDAASRIIPLQVTLANRKKWCYLNWAEEVRQAYYVIQSGGTYHPWGYTEMRAR